MPLHSNGLEIDLYGSISSCLLSLQVNKYLVPLAIPLLLLDADLRRVRP